MDRKKIFVSAVTFLCFNYSASCFATDVLSQIHPYLSLKEEYTDNLNLTNTNRIEDYVSTITPGIKFSNMDAKSGVDLDAALGAVLYLKNSDFNYLRGDGSLNAKYLTSSHFNFFLKDYFSRTNDPRERELNTTAADNKYMIATQTHRAVYLRNVVEPTMEYMFGPESRLGINYRNNIYRTERIIAQDSTENYFNPYLFYWFNKENGINIDYAYTNGDFESSPDLNGHKITGRYLNRFIRNSTVFLEGIYTTRSFSDTINNYDIYEGSIGINYTFSPTLLLTAQVGYYWMEFNKIAIYNYGPTFKGELISLDVRTTYRLSIQGGYAEDYFTSQNLGFQRYYRGTGSITHFFDKRFSMGALASIERTESSPVERNDTFWTVTGTASYMPVRWLNISLAYTHSQRLSNDTTEEYNENRVMLMATATY